MKRKNRLNICLLILVGLIAVFITGCKKDDPEQEPITVTDIDGNVYHTVTIGTQVWMVENLKVTRYRNGDVIGTTTPVTNTSYEKEPKYQWVYDGDERNVASYGRLYTWFAATDSRSVCPQGWHIPTAEEMIILRDYLIANGYNYDGTTSGNKCAKALASKSEWILIGTEGVVGNTDYPEKRNITGFNGLPGGYRGVGKAFYEKGQAGVWWSSSEYTEDFPYVMGMSNSLPGLHIGAIFTNHEGLSVRCIRD
jgi:uncharacterized protein (TIGR02145 family)